MAREHNRVCLKKDLVYSAHYRCPSQQFAANSAAIYLSAVRLAVVLGIYVETDVVAVAGDAAVAVAVVGTTGALEYAVDYMVDFPHELGGQSCTHPRFVRTFRRMELVAVATAGANGGEAQKICVDQNHNLRLKFPQH